MVQNAQTGLLTPENDVDAFRAAVRRLVQDTELRATMSGTAREFVWSERSLEHAASRLKQLLGGLA